MDTCELRIADPSVIMARAIVLLQGEYATALRNLSDGDIERVIEECFALLPFITNKEEHTLAFSSLATACNHYRFEIPVNRIGEIFPHLNEESQFITAARLTDPEHLLSIASTGHWHAYAFTRIAKLVNGKKVALNYVVRALNAACGKSYTYLCKEIYRGLLYQRAHYELRDMIACIDLIEDEKYREKFAGEMRNKLREYRSEDLCQILEGLLRDTGGRVQEILFEIISEPEFQPTRVEGLFLELIDDHPMFADVLRPLLTDSYESMTEECLMALFRNECLAGRKALQPMMAAELLLRDRSQYKHLLGFDPDKPENDAVDSDMTQ
jgi:hypothetical protein